MKKTDKGTNRRSGKYCWDSKWLQYHFLSTLFLHVRAKMLWTKTTSWQSCRNEFNPCIFVYIFKPFGVHLRVFLWIWEAVNINTFCYLINGQTTCTILIFHYFNLIAYTTHWQKPMGPNPLSKTAQNICINELKQKLIWINHILIG